MKTIRLTLLTLFTTTGLFAQNLPDWHGRKCAVALTYDDALQVHLDKAIPALDAAGLKGTFYLAGNFPGLKARIADWKRAAANGHELGNHTLFHPCAGGPGREWVKPAHDLNTYTMARILDEVRMTNTLLEVMDSQKDRTFAFPCGDRMVEGKNYYDPVKNDFVAARGVISRMQKAENIDLTNVDAYVINGQTGEQMIDLVKQAIATNSVLVFLFHGVGGEHNLNVDEAEHKKLVQFLKQHEKEVWTASFLDVARSVKTFQQTRRTSTK